MKVHITLQTTANPQVGTHIDLVVGSCERVSEIKQRVAEIQLIPFPHLVISFQSQVLQDEQTLAKCGVVENSPLELTIKASEETLVSQLCDLLKARDLSADELGLLYSYKYGANIRQALKILGSDEKVADFIRRQKALQIENGQVALCRKETALKPFSVASEIEAILKDTPDGQMEIKELCSLFLQKFNVSLATLSGTRVTEYLAKEKNTFTVTGKTVLLKSFRPRAPTVLETRSQAPVIITEHVASCKASGQQYLDLHSQICSRSFAWETSQALNDFVELVSKTTFLNIDHIVMTGSVGKDIAIKGSCDAEVVFFLNGLPPTGRQSWLPPLLKALANILSDIEDEHIQDVRATSNAVSVVAYGTLKVNLQFSPVHENYSEALKAVKKHNGTDLMLASTSLAEERLEFIVKQPSAVKVTIRLLKWWRDQQSWSSPQFRPSDDILELVAVYSALGTEVTNQLTAIASIMQLFSDFADLCIMWCNYYSHDEVPQCVSGQRPLVMDPVNPFINTADPNIFDASELIKFARKTNFFW